MSDHDQHSELDALYQARKARHSMPPGSKHAILAAEEKRAGWAGWLIQVQWWLGAAGIVLFVGLVVSLPPNETISDSDTLVSNIQIHSLDEADINPVNSTQTRYAKYYAAYLQRQRILVAHHSEQAVGYATGQGWTFETCDQQTLLVSQAVMDGLMQLNKLEQDLQPGHNVMIEFDRQGLIVSIFAAPELPHCGEHG